MHYSSVILQTPEVIVMLQTPEEIVMLHRPEEIVETIESIQHIYTANGLKATTHTTNKPSPWVLDLINPTAGLEYQKRT